MTTPTTPTSTSHPDAPHAPLLRYAVLHHTGVAAPHFDLMFETAPGASLATWRSPVWPIREPLRLERLPDHRPTYLTYEGPVGGDRGEVRRVADGPFRLEHQSDGQLQLLTDQGLRLHLRRQRDGVTWVATVGQTA